MPALVCDICGGRLKIGEGKTAVCESCGMEHSLERMRQKYKEVKGVVHVDDAHLAENYYALAQDAYDADNKSEAERYCNKIIETNPDDFDAFFLKGKAVGWQTSLVSPRFKEAAICFANAINTLPDKDSKKESNVLVEEELKSLATAFIRQRCDCFSDDASDRNADGFKENLKEVSTAIDLYEKSTGLHVNRNNVFGNVSAIVQGCMTTVSLLILLKYKISGTKTAYSTLVSKTDNCIEIMQRTADLCDDDDQSDAKLYQQIIDMTQTLIDTNEIDSVRNKWGAFVKTPRLSDTDISSRRQTIETMRNRISRIRNR